MSDCSTHAYDVPLKPCPFCGGEATMKHVTELWEPKDSYWAACKCCHMSGRHYRTEAEAIAAWNSRAEMDYEDALILLDELGVSERTCRWEYPQGVNGWIGYTVCSSCGEKYDECVTDTAHYCPNCGAKVVGE